MVGASVGQRSCRRVLAGLPAAAVQCCIDEEGHGGHDAAGGACQLLHIAGVVAGHEALFGIGVAVGSLAVVAPGPEGQGGVVAGALQHAHLILYLHHHHGAGVAVLLLQVLHQGGEGLQVGLQHIGAEGTGYL